MVVSTDESIFLIFSIHFLKFPKKLVSVKLIQHGSMEKYVNEILMLWKKIKVAGFKIEEQVIASLMLGGLPEECRAMILEIVEFCEGTDGRLCEDRSFTGDHESILR